MSQHFPFMSDLTNEDKSKTSKKARNFYFNICKLSKTPTLHSQQARDIIFSGTKYQE